MAMKLTMRSIKARFPKVSNVSTESLQALQDGASDTERLKSLIILDTRPSIEYDVSHLPGAVRVDPEGSDVETTLEMMKGHSGDGPTLVVCYCSVGYRSSRYADLLLTKLKDRPEISADICNLEGSIFKWANEGRPLVDAADKPTTFVHPYNYVFGKLLNEELRWKS